MGHTAVKGLSRAVIGINWDDSTPTLPCQVCARANIKRLPFPSASSTRADRPLFRIHSDICGPLPNSYGSFKYFILFIDCYSHFIFIFFLRKKSEALKTFIEFKTTVEKFHSLPIVILRVDNAPEYIYGEFETYCRENGITYEKIVPGASPQNGVAERANYTVASMS